MASQRGPLKLGLVGGGITSSIGRSHISAAHLDGRYKIEAGSFSSDINQSIKTAEMWGLDTSRAYNNIENMVANEKNKLDAIAILTPTPLHLENYKILAKAKIPIICEKPLASTVKEALEVKKISIENNNFTAVTFNYSGYPMLRSLSERIKNNDLGEILDVRIEMPQEFFLKLDPTTGQLTKPKGWRLKDGYIPTICLDLGVHLHHISEFLTGLKIKEVNASFSNNVNYPTIVDNVTMMLKYNNGASGAFWFSKAALGHRNGLLVRIYGTKGSAEWNHEIPELLKLSLNNGDRLSMDRGCIDSVATEERYGRYRVGHPAGFIEAFANVYYDIADALWQYKKNGNMERKYVYGIDHSLEGLRLFEAAVLSNKFRTWQIIN